MFAYGGNKCKGPLGLLALLALAAALLVAGCGGDAGSSTSGATGTGTAIPVEPDGGNGSGAPPPAELPDPDVADADPGDVEVIDEWSKALTEGDIGAAAGYFAIPSIAENGPTLKIRNEEDAVTFNEALPCGATLVSAETTGEITTAEFLLSERPGGGCGPGAGGTASTSFVIADGKITEWRRVGTDPGVGGSDGATTT